MAVGKKKVGTAAASGVIKEKVTKVKVVPANASLICQLDHWNFYSLG
jgi:hypothetical protein